jgi:hypothetical protein
VSVGNWDLCWEALQPASAGCPVAVVGSIPVLSRQLTCLARGRNAMRARQQT